jgi:hypothetical protein
MSRPFALFVAIKRAQILSFMWISVLAPVHIFKTFLAEQLLLFNTMKLGIVGQTFFTFEMLRIKESDPRLCLGWIDVTVNDVIFPQILAR